MKISYYFLILILFMSCQSEQEKLIGEYVQTLGDTKIDLKFKANSCKLIRSITVKDSIKLTKEFFEKRREQKIDDLYWSIKQDKNEIEFAKEWMRLSPDNKEEKIKEINEYLKSIEEKLKLIESCETDCKGTYLYDVYKKIENYESMDESKPLGYVYRCEYTIYNPMLKTTQQLKKDFYFNSEKTKVINSESVKLTE